MLAAQPAQMASQNGLIHASWVTRLPVHEREVQGLLKALSSGQCGNDDGWHGLHKSGQPIGWCCLVGDMLQGFDA